MGGSETLPEAEPHWTPERVKDELAANGVTDEVLLHRAVANARNPFARKGEKHPRWTAVMSVFVLGSGYSNLLCKRFGIDPDEMVKRA